MRGGGETRGAPAKKVVASGIKYGAGLSLSYWHESMIDNRNGQVLCFSIFSLSKKN